MIVGFCFRTATPARAKVKAMKPILRQGGHEMRFFDPEDFVGQKHDVNVLFLDMSHPSAESIAAAYKGGKKGSPGIPVVDLGKDAGGCIAAFQEIINAKDAPRQAAPKEDK